MINGQEASGINLSNFRTWPNLRPSYYLVTAVFCKLIVFYNDCYFRSQGHANKPSGSDRNHGIFRIDWTELWLVTGRLLTLMDGLSYELSWKKYRACNNRTKPVFVDLKCWCKLQCGKVFCYKRQQLNPVVFLGKIYWLSTWPAFLLKVFYFNPNMWDKKAAYLTQC